MHKQTIPRRHIRLLAAEIQALPEFSMGFVDGPAYRHMTALLADAVLQAGLNYRTVVKPRVARILSLWPSAVLTSDAACLLLTPGVSDLLRWKHPEKLTRFTTIVNFLSGKSIESVVQLGEWLRDEHNATEILSLRGVGLKTLDYLRNLAGVPTIAVDRHIRGFVEGVGIPCGTYNHVHMLVKETARYLNISPAAVDHAIWLNRSKSS